MPGALTLALPAVVTLSGKIGAGPSGRTSTYPTCPASVGPRSSTLLRKLWQARPASSGPPVHAVTVVDGGTTSERIAGSTLIGHAPTSTCRREPYRSVTAKVVTAGVIFRYEIPPIH